MKGIMLSIEQIEAACRNSDPVVLADPVSSRTPLPLQETFYPLGFPVEIATNSKEVLHAAAESWAAFGKMFDTQPIQVRIAVTKGRFRECPPVPVCRLHQNLFSYIADSENFGICDLEQGLCFLGLTEAAVEHPKYLRFYFLEAAALGQLSVRHATPVHAACVELEGSGVLLCGDSGAGKSTLAYACAQAGWTYITDDASYVINDRDDRLIAGDCNQARFRPSAAEFFPELDGKEVMQRAGRSKPSIELSTPPFRNIVRANTAHIDHVVFLNRREVREPMLRPFSREVARYFMQQPLIRMPEMLKVQDAAIERMLEAQLLELQYQELDWAIDRLSSLVRDRQ
jgi:hypothetical protein